MILDSSAIIAILLEEPARERLLERIDSAAVAVGAPTLVETGMVLSSRLGGDPRPLLQGFLRRADVEVIPFREEHWEAALDAFQRFGKGRHPAALNMGDCLAYAAASVAGLPLLFTGQDFGKTDVREA